MDAKTLLETCQAQENACRFAQFSRADALKLGLQLHQNAAERFADPVAIEITVNGLVVFRYFPDGARKDSELWLARKRRAVELMGMCSLGFGAWLETHGETLESRKLDPNDYAPGGGGFPIVVEGTGVIGTICVSGCDDHLDDHQLVVDTLTAYL